MNKIYKKDRKIDKEGGPTGRVLRDWRDSLIADLGGPDAISTQQLALIRLLLGLGNPCTEPGVHISFHLRTRAGDRDMTSPGAA